MNINKFYEEEWISRKMQKFWDYNRNLVLPELILKTLKPKKALDLACGNGIVSRFIKNQGYEVTAVDISKEAIKQVKSKGIKKSFVLSVEEKLPFKSKFFDLVFWGDNIEHVIYPERVLHEIKRLLKRNGRLIISTPNMGFFLYRWHFFKTGQLPRTEGIPSEPWEWKHIRFFNFKSLKALLNKNNFKITKIKGIKEPGIYGTFSKIFPKLFSSIIVIDATYKS